MYLEIVSPERTLFNGDVESVLVPGTDGSFQMLNNHAPIVSTLIKGTVKILGDINISDDWICYLTKQRGFIVLHSAVEQFPIFLKREKEFSNFSEHKLICEE